MSRCIFALLASVTAFVLLISQVASAADPILNIGDPAPAMMVSSWLKGDKVKQFDPDKVYVVEFWATWCGPCCLSIPHLTELAHQYKEKGVQFVGVDIWEDDVKKVQPFVDKRGDKMDYNVVLDLVPDETKPREGVMAKTWLAAADEKGIPTAFVIQNGKIAWIGYPNNLDEPLAKIIAGQWNLADMAQERLARKEKERKLMAVIDKVLTPYHTRDYQAALVAIDEILKGSPELTDDLAGYKFAALAKSGQTDQALKLGEQLFETNKDNAVALNDAFWEIIDSGSVAEVDPRLAKLALKALSRAAELTKEQDAGVLESLAEAQFRTGDATAAIATEEKAMEVVKEEYKDFPGIGLAQFKARINRFRHAAEKKSNEAAADKNKSH